MAAPVISLRAVTRQFPGVSPYVAIRDVSFDVPQGQFLSLVGPSGCGKSTLLNLIAGLDQPSSGTILIEGQPLAGINRRAGYMFQQDALLPWKTLLDNVLLGPLFRNQANPAFALEWLRRAGLEDFAHFYPAQLSGGMRKRAALLQQWIINPPILLMDEPFSALDIHTRHRMEQELLDLWSTSRPSVVFVTHDLEEAISLADRVVVLSAGPASTIVSSSDIDLPRPRNLLDLRTEPAFLDIYRRVWSDLRGEVIKTYGRLP